MEQSRLYPCTIEDSQIHFIITGVKRGWFDKKEAKKALKKLRNKKIIEDNMYQAHDYT